MRKVFLLVLVIATTAAGCGDGDGGSGTDPAAANSCEELADVGINLMQDAVDQLDEMSLTDFTELASSDQMPAEMQQLEDIGNRLEARGDELGCSDEEGQQLMCERIDQLTADGEVGKLILEVLEGEC